MPARKTVPTQKTGPAQKTGPTQQRWLLLIYRVPAQPTAARVAVWRTLKRLGAFYLQQAVCALPDRPELRTDLAKVRERIEQADGMAWQFELSDIDAELEKRLVTGFREQSKRDYAEIVEECETKFFKEIEFERYRENYTFEETEEIRQDLEKLRSWFARVSARDWMDAPGRELAIERIAECERLLEEFETDVFERTSGTE